MARLFLTKEEAQAWGLIPKTLDKHTLKQKVLIRVIAGLTVLLLASCATIGYPLISNYVHTRLK